VPGRWWKGRTGRPLCAPQGGSVKVRLYICRLDEEDQPVEIVEDYTVPDGSWVQTRTAGAQPAYAVLEPTCWVFQRGGFAPGFGGEKFVIIWEPVNPPYAPEWLLRLVNGRDRRWGRNGTECMGKCRERYGGTALKRAREYAVWYRFMLESVNLDDPHTSDRWRDWPVALSEEEIAMILEERPVQMAGSVPVGAGAGAGFQDKGKEQLPLFALGG